MALSGQREKKECLSGPIIVDNQYGRTKRNAFFSLFVVHFWPMYPFPIDRLLSYTVREQLGFGGLVMRRLSTPGVRDEFEKFVKSHQRARTNEPKRQSVVHRAYCPSSVRRRVLFSETVSF